MAARMVPRLRKNEFLMLPSEELEYPAFVVPGRVAKVTHFPRGQIYAEETNLMILEPPEAKGLKKKAIAAIGRKLMEPTLFDAANMVVGKKVESREKKLYVIGPVLGASTRKKNGARESVWHVGLGVIKHTPEERMAKLAALVKRLYAARYPGHKVEFLNAKKIRGYEWLAKIAKEQKLKK